MQNNSETEEYLMKAFAMLKIGEVGMLKKSAPLGGVKDAVCKPLAVAILHIRCTYRMGRRGR